MHWCKTKHIFWIRFPGVAKLKLHSIWAFKISWPCFSDTNWDASIFWWEFGCTFHWCHVKHWVQFCAVVKILPFDWCLHSISVLWFVRHWFENHGGKHLWRCVCSGQGNKIKDPFSAPGKDQLTKICYWWKKDTVWCHQCSFLWMDMSKEWCKQKCVEDAACIVTPINCNHSHG